VDEVFPAEDSLSLLERPTRGEIRDLSIAVIRLPCVANFTDFDPLEAESTVQVRYVLPEQSLGQPDAVILPGSKATIADMQVLQTSGLAKQIQTYAQAGGMVLGICGGLQMLGEAIADPDGIEGMTATVSGLGLLPLQTTMQPNKITQQRTTQACSLPDLFGAGVITGEIQGYEIHQGQTQLLDPAAVDFLFTDAELGVAKKGDRILGTYLHDLFTNGPWRRAWLNQLRHCKGLTPLETNIPHYAIQRDHLLDRITDAVAPHLNLTTLLRTSPP
jgi:adenosylcobyric acid synthase